MSSRIIRGDGRAKKPTVSAADDAIDNRPTQEQIMQIEKQAFDQGFAEGERAGKQMAEAMVETICRRHEKSCAEVAASHKAIAQSMEEQTVQLALEIARKIVQRELATDPDLVAALAAVALKRVSGHLSITLRVSRNDSERVRAAIASVNPSVSVKEDPALDRGDFLIETGQTHLDGRLSDQIETIGRALLEG
jgi:flagellar assembly protein FliH